MSPVYISDALLPENAPADWDTPYLNLALRCETQLTPHELLQHVKQIEKKVGRVPNEIWGPRVMDIDLLAWDDQLIYDDKLHIPHEHLTDRPFALWPLADVAPFWIYPLPGKHSGKTAAEIVAEWGSRFSNDAPFHTRQIAQRIDTPQLVGIINVTPDSFSDGGKYIDSTSVIECAKQFMLDGADIIDIGAEATNPRATAISADEEWKRLEPILKAICIEKNNFFIPPKISLDTRHPTVAEKALALEIDWINDVSGLDNAKMCEVIAKNSCDVVIMHHLGIPVDKNKILSLEKNPVDQVLAWMEKKLKEITSHGINRERIILDPGIGFGKNAAQCLELINQADRFHELGCRLLIGHSRKLFLGQFTDKSFSERDIETLVLSLFLAEKQLNYLRVHNVEMHARMLKVMKTLDHPK